MNLVDVLPLLPPDTRITGCVGDGSSYLGFETTAGTARVDIARTCAEHAANWLEMHARFSAIVTSPTTPASTWFSSQREVIAELPALGIHLVLDTPSRPFPDIRTDPWVVRGVRVDAYDTTSWSDPPNAVENAVAHLRTLANLLGHLSPGAC